MTSLDQLKIDRLIARARREIDEGLLPSCQIALGYEGEIVVTNGYDQHQIREPRRGTAISTVAAQCVKP